MPKFNAVLSRQAPCCRHEQTNDGGQADRSVPRGEVLLSHDLFVEVDGAKPTQGTEQRKQVQDPKNIKLWHLNEVSINC